MSFRHSRSALFVAACVFANGLGAQNAQLNASAIVTGTVRDSIASGYLANAAVQLVGVDNPAIVFDALSDSLGRFRINNVSPGHYRIGFFHPILDSLGVEAPLRDVYVKSPGSVTANVGVPSASTLRGVICGSKPDGGSGAVIVGTLRNAKDGLPMSKVSVFGEWYDFALRRGGMARELVRRYATSADNGWFALCNVPADGTVTLVATTGADSTGLIEVQIPRVGFVRRDLYLDEAEATSPASAVTGSDPHAASGVVAEVSRIRIGNGRVSGTVRTAVGSRPLANAQVSITNGPQTRTDADGHWTISNSPSGTRTIVVHALGYYPEVRSVNVIAGAGPVNISLSTLKAMLDTIRVRASRLPNDLNGTGFNYRRRSGAGRYVTPADLERLPVIVTSQIFRRTPGLRTDSDSLLMRGAFAAWCHPAIFIDDRNMSFLSTDEIDDLVPPEHIAGIEIYSEASAPPQFQNAMGGCGSIVIWTK